MRHAAQNALCVLLFVGTALGIAGCDRKTATPQDADGPAVPAPSASEVAAADGFGAEGEATSAVAFWSHPSVNFESLVLAATDSGVKSLRIETGEIVSSIEQGPVDAIAVVYSGEGSAANGYVIAGRPNAYEFYAIDNSTGALSSAIVTSGAPRAGAFCAGRSNGGVALYEIAANIISRRDISFAPSAIALGDPQKISDSGGASCHVDDRSGNIITISANGAIRRIDATTGESFGLALAAERPSATALMIDGAGDNSAGAVLTLDGARGVVSLYDLIDGHALGAVRIKSTFDLDAVASAKTIAAGYGNYGGVYRDGAVAVVTSGAGAPIRLTSWKGILDALKQPPAVNVNPRAPQPVVADERVIDIEFGQP